MHISAGQLDSAISVCKGILNEPDLKNYKTVKKDTERLLERTQNVEG
jgi:hypothetical protein